MNDARHKFYQQHRDIFSWYSVDEYACYDVLTVAPETIEKVKQAATKVWQILNHAAFVMKQFDERTLIEFDYPQQTLRLIKNNRQPPFIARCDFAVVGDNIYLLECNAEVATFIVETFKINGIVAKHFGKVDPNINAEAILKKGLNQYIEESAKYLNKSPEDCNIIFAALSQAPEDIGTVQYLMSLCHYQSAFCPIESIAMDENVCYDHTGEPVDIIYRIYPTEWMVEDKDPQLGVSLWDYFEPLVYSHKLALINPVSAFVVQNKALMALITELGIDFFSQNNLTGFEHFLPTFMEQAKINPPFVAKPTWGREGREVEVIKIDKKIASNPDPEYAHFAKVYQKYANLPTIMVDKEEYKLQFSCFLINGIAGGVAARIGKDVINNHSKFLPIGC